MCFTINVNFTLNHLSGYEVAEWKVRLLNCKCFRFYKNVDTLKRLINEMHKCQLLLCFFFTPIGVEK